MRVREMFKSGAAAVAFALLSSTAANAESRCGAQNVTPFPAMEEVREAFFNLDHETMRPLFVAPVDLSALAGLLDQVKAVAPDGFDECTTILQRVDNGGFVQEVTLFATPNAEVFLYVAGYPATDGKIGVRAITFNTEFSEVMDVLR